MLALHATHEYTPSFTAMTEVLLHTQLAVVGFHVRDPRHVQLLWSLAAPLE